MSHDIKIIRELLLVKNHLSNKTDMAYSFETKDRSSSDGKPFLPKILRKAMQKKYKMKEIEDVRFFLLSLLEHVFDDTRVCDNSFTSTLACVEKCLSCNNLTGSIADLAIIGINVWPSDRNDTIDLESLFQGTFCCDVDMLGRKHCTSCDL